MFFCLFAYVIHIAAKKFSFIIAYEDSPTLDPDHIVCL